jgi:hypothetical protein
LTIPALLGAENVINIVEQCHQAALCAVGRHLPPSMHGRTVQALADEWPEHVLGPENPLTFLTSDMRCTFFDA